MKKMEEEARVVAELLRALANENRLMILCSLIEGPENVGELQKKMGNISQSALSQHLALLKARQILGSEKKGQTITYFIQDKRIEKVIAVLKENYCRHEEVYQ